MADQPVAFFFRRQNSRIVTGIHSIPDEERAAFAGTHGLSGEQHAFLQEMEESFYPAELVPSPPGSGKSRDATQYITQMWREKGRKGLYLMLSNDAIDERLQHIKADGDAEIWHRWESHKDACERRRFAEKGYLGAGHCTCGRGPITAEGPTIAPLEYILPNLPNVHQPLAKVASEFDFWVVDEVDLRRYLGREEVTLAEVETAATSHPSEPIKLLSAAFAMVMKVAKTSRVSGEQLHRGLESAFAALGTDSQSVRQSLSDESIERANWMEGAITSLPRNFPLVLVPVWSDEWSQLNEGESWNPRIHIEPRISEEGSPAQSVLRVWWRKELARTYQPEFTFFLDATGDPDLMNKAVPETLGAEPSPPEWPANVHVHQLYSNLVSRNDLGLRYQGSAHTTESRSRREAWYQRIENELAPLSKDLSVGVITHKAMHEELADRVRALGFSDVRSLWYGAERGSNELEDIRVLVMLGLPIPNVEEFKEETQAFFYDGTEVTFRGQSEVFGAKELSFDWSPNRVVVDTAAGGKVPVHPKGYWSPPVSNYYLQKCAAGLFQALNRIRPYNRRDYERHVFVFTNFPIDGVKVTEYLDIDGRRWATATEHLREQTATEEVSTTELAKVVMDVGATEKAAKKWVQRNASELAELMGLAYTPGTGRRPGRFEG
jgi:hypothetical protein